MAGKVFPGLALHSFFENMPLDAATAAGTWPPVDNKLLDPTGITGTEIIFGTGTGTYGAAPRGFKVLVDGNLNYRIGPDGADSTETFAAGHVELGLIGRITKDGSTTTSIKLLY